MKNLIASVALFAVIAGTFLHAQTMIGINYAGSNIIAASDEAGISTARQTNWNNLTTQIQATPNTRSLVADDGSAAGSVSYFGAAGASDFTSSAPTTTPDGLLMRRFAYATDAGVTIEVTGLTAAFSTPGYELIIYYNTSTAGVNLGTKAVTVDYGMTGTNEVATSFSNSTGQTFQTVADYAEGVNYIRISNIASSGTDSFRLNISENTGSQRGVFNGMQIVAIPEPSTYAFAGALLLLGLVPLCAKRVRRASK